MLTMERKTRLKKAGILGIATGGFVGFIPLAPGTVGSAVGVALIWGLKGISLPLFILLCFLIFALGVWASDKAGQLLNKADASPIVIDEIVGMMITMIGIPVTGYWLVIGFLLFRFFDIVKLPPANILDARLKSGWGVMLDDVFAGIYANILLHLMLRATF